MFDRAESDHTENQECNLPCVLNGLQGSECSSKREMIIGHKRKNINYFSEAKHVKTELKENSEANESKALDDDDDDGGTSDYLVFSQDNTDISFNIPILDDTRYGNVYNERNCLCKGISEVCTGSGNSEELPSTFDSKVSTSFRHKKYLNSTFAFSHAGGIYPNTRECLNCKMPFMPSHSFGNSPQPGFEKQTSHLCNFTTLYPEKEFESKRKTFSYTNVRLNQSSDYTMTKFLQSKHITYMQGLQLKLQGKNAKVLRGFSVNSPAAESSIQNATGKVQAISDVSLFVPPSQSFTEPEKPSRDITEEKENHKGTFGAYKNKNESEFFSSYGGCVTNFIEPSFFTKRSNWENILKEDNIWASFGVHPHFSNKYDGIIEDILRNALKHQKVVAVGEIGLDYSSKNNCDKDLQQQIFKRQLAIAVASKKPVIIHCRDAQKDCLRILLENVPRDIKIHRHCFTGNWIEAQEWLEKFPNLFLGFTSLITFRSARHLHEVVKFTPVQRLLFETDSPYFVPSQVLDRMAAKDSKNRKFSHPGMVAHVAAQIATIKGIKDFPSFLATVRENTRIMYSI